MTPLGSARSGIGIGDEESFLRPVKKSVEFSQIGNEECLLVLRSNESLHVDHEGETGAMAIESQQDQQQQQFETFCHLPSSFV